MSALAAAPPRLCRVLYYGPGGAGKRENLRQIQGSLPTEHRLDVAADDPDRQIAFLLRNGDQGDWRVLVQAVDAGRERYRTAGCQDEPPFDGIIFVINSESSRLDQSLSSLESLKTYLDTWERDLMSVPVVIQYNRREAPDVLSVDRLESLLNPWGLLSFPADSRRGEGVKESLRAILGLTISHVLQRDAAAAGTQTHVTAEPADDLRDFDPAPPVPGTTHPSEVKPQSSLTDAAPRDNAVNPVRAPRPPAAPTNERGGLDFQHSTVGLFNDLRPPIVVPVRIPRQLLVKYDSARIILEVEITDDEGVLL